MAMLAPSILSKKIRLDTPPIVDEARRKDTTRRLDRFGREVVEEVVVQLASRWMWSEWCSGQWGMR